MNRAPALPALICLALVVDPAQAADDASLEVEAPDLPAVGSATFSIDTRSTFLRANAETAATGARAIDLGRLGLEPGTLIRLEALGEFSWSADELPEDATSMIGVFSSSATLLAADNLHRVTGALDAAPEIETAPTLFGGIATDIAQDFPIVASELRIPAGARYLFVAAPDIFYSDNLDRDGNYVLRITVPKEAD